MRRAFCILLLLVFAASGTRSCVNVYPPLTRETLVGTWEAVHGISTILTVFHFSFGPEGRDSYLSEIYPEYMSGRLFRMDECTVKADGKISFHFRSDDGSGWWFDGEGYGDEKTAWIKGTFGTDATRRDSGPMLYMQKGLWVRSIGEASKRAEEKIKEIRGNK
jgi:hypothetical protein